MFEPASLLDQRALDPHLARAMLDLIDNRRREALRLVVVLGGASAALLLLGVRALLLPLVAGAAGALVLWLQAADRRRGLVRSLMAQRSAYVLPEVARAGERLATPKARAALAASLERLVGLARRSPVAGPSFMPTERIAAHADELLELASLVGRAEAVVHPAAVALLQRIVTSSLESPLLNLDVPEADLAMLLRRVTLALEG